MIPHKHTCCLFLGRNDTLRGIRLLEDGVVTQKSYIAHTSVGFGLACLGCVVVFLVVFCGEPGLLQIARRIHEA